MIGWMNTIFLVKKGINEMECSIKIHRYYPIWIWSGFWIERFREA